MVLFNITCMGPLETASERKLALVVPSTISIAEPGCPSISSDKGVLIYIVDGLIYLVVPCEVGV